MKIYEIGTGYTPIPAKMGAATEIVVEELTKSFIKMNKDITIIDIKSNNRVENQLPIIEVKVPQKFQGTDVQLGIMHKLKRVVYSIKLSFKLKKIINKSSEKVIVHFHNQYNMYFFLKLTSKKIRKRCFIAYTNHSYIWHGEWKKIKKTIKHKYFQEVFSMINADMIYVLNNHTIENLVKHIGINKNKIALVDNGVNPDIYYPQTAETITEFKEKLNLKDRRIYLQIGSVCDRKNQMGALKLLLPILMNDKKSVYIYAGGIISEEYQKCIVEYAKKNNISDQIIYAGELKPGIELNNYYNISDAMIFPSKSEGFSLVIIEAMSAGIPVVINEKLKFKLSNECLRYSTNDDFIEIINKNILNKQQHEYLATKSRKVVLENYSWDKVAASYYQSWERGK